MFFRIALSLGLLLAIPLPAVPSAGYQLIFTPGNGARYQLTLGEGLESEAEIYVSEASPNIVGFEMHFKTSLLGMPIELWQQTRYEKRADGKIVPLDAFFQSKEMKRAELFELEQIRSPEALQVGDILLQDPNAMTPLRIGQENLLTQLGLFETVHFRRSKAGHTLDYWLNPKLKPLGIVRIESRGKNTYTLNLITLLRKMDRKINPTEASALTTEGRDLLSTPRVFPFP
jgi:hypothetical protein